MPQSPSSAPPVDKKASQPIQDSPESEDEPEVTTKKRRAGCESPLTNEQKEVVDGYIPAWESLLTKLKLHLGKDGKSQDDEEVTKWISTTLKAILKKPEFSSSAVVRTLGDWNKVSGERQHRI